jgi:hypothetical protein
VAQASHAFALNSGANSQDRGVRMKFAFIIVGVAASTCTLLGCGGGPGGRGGPPGGGAMMISGPGGGGPQVQPRELMLRRFDADADGDITRAEFDAVIKVDFAAADAEDDGALSTAETRAVNERLLTQRDISPIIDWNADGRVSPDEFAAQWRTLFARADADGDGTVTAAELSARAGPAERPPRGSGKPPRGRPPGAA